MSLTRVNSKIFNQNPSQYELVSGNTKGAPKCPYGNTYQWIGYNHSNDSFVRFTKSIFKKLIQRKTMSVINNIATFLKKKAKNETIVAPQGFCPNCWGRQEYGGNFYNAMKSEGIDIANNIDQKKGWIQDYVNKNLSSIVLQRKGTSKTCSVCYSIYNHEH